jgi:hypothetical protein
MKKNYKGNIIDNNSYSSSWQIFKELLFICIIGAVNNIEFSTVTDNHRGLSN